MYKNIIHNLLYNRNLWCWTLIVGRTSEWKKKRLVRPSYHDDRLKVKKLIVFMLTFRVCLDHRFVSITLCLSDNVWALEERSSVVDAGWSKTSTTPKSDACLDWPTCCFLALLLSSRSTLCDGKSLELWARKPVWALLLLPLRLCSLRGRYGASLRRPVDPSTDVFRILPPKTGCSSCELTELDRAIAASVGKGSVKLLLKLTCFRSNESFDEFNVGCVSCTETAFLPFSIDSSAVGDEKCSVRGKCNVTAPHPLIGRLSVIRPTPVRVTSVCAPPTAIETPPPT